MYSKFVGAPYDTVNFYGDSGLAEISKEAFVEASIALLGPSEVRFTPKTTEVEPVQVEVTPVAEPVKENFTPVLAEGAFEFVRRRQLEEHHLRCMIHHDPFSAVTELAIGKYLYTSRMVVDEFVEMFDMKNLNRREQRSRTDGLSSNSLENTRKYWARRCNGLMKLYAALATPSSENGVILRKYLKDEGVTRVEQLLTDRTALIATARKECNEDA